MVICILHREKKSFFSTRNIRKNLSRKILSINNFLFQHNIQGFKDRRENVFKESDWLTYLWFPTGNFSAEIWKRKLHGLNQVILLVFQDMIGSEPSYLSFSRYDSLGKHGFGFQNW